MNQTITIIGAGPAGSMLAHKLASREKKVILYDHRAPWEKPCGGMLGPDTIHENPELENYPYPVNLCNGIVCISPRKDRKLLHAEKGIPVIARIELSRYLLDMARASGAEFIPKKVLAVSYYNRQWVIETDDGSHGADIIVGADGVNSIVRKATIGKFPDQHLSLTCGYFLNQLPQKQCLMKFLDMEGYIWVFSRADHTSVGIGTKLGVVSGKSLFKLLDDFLDENYPGIRKMRKYSALIPTATDEHFFDLPCCGDNWLLVGDAAGHVDPIAGEGIYYALGSAKMACRAILSGDIHSYDKLWKDKYGEILEQGASFRKKLSKLAQNFGSEIIGAMMFAQGL